MAKQFGVLKYILLSLINSNFCIRNYQIVCTWELQQFSAHCAKLRFLKLWLSEAWRSEVNSSEMWELSMFAKKICCFRNSAVWVSLLQLLLLNFPPEFPDVNLKKTTTQPTECFGKQSESRLGWGRGGSGSAGWWWSPCPVGAGVEQWDRTASWCPTSLSCFPPRCHWSQA